MQIAFLKADVPLSKRFSAPESGTFHQTGTKVEPYPHVKDFTSETAKISTLSELHKAIQAHAKLGHCLLKGNLLRELNEESRAGATKTDDLTEWVVLDLDSAPFKSPKEAMKVLGLDDVSYVVQYSASYGLPNHKGLSCHIFMLLSHAYHAPYVKTWLMKLNLEVKELRQALCLTASNAYLHWPLDITACQNDKLIYIAPPTVGKGVEYKHRSIEYVAGKLASLPIDRLKAPTLESLKKQATEIINAKRVEAGIDKLRAQTKWVGEYEIQAKPGEVQITGIKHERGFTYLNLNGGNSWGYYHPEENFEIIHNFKGEPCYLTKELLPGYYKDCVAARRQLNRTPIEDGTVIAAILERRTARYWKMEWNPVTYELRLDPAKSEVQLEHFLNGHGRSLNGDFIPQWDLHFSPQDDVIVDEEAKRLNLFVPSKYYRMPRRKVTTPDKFPTIHRLITHVISNGSDTTEIYYHAMNWFAVIIQKRAKTGTALVNSGTYGTGKGLLVGLLHTMLGNRYVAFKRSRDLEDKFTAWLEENLIISVDEAQVSAQHAMKETVHNELKTWITDNPIGIRRMNVDPYHTQSYCNFIFSSNRRDPVQMVLTDRRFNFGIYQEKPLPLTADEIRAMPNEIEEFFQYLMCHKADVDYARKIISNETRNAVAEANMTSIDFVAKALITGDLAYLWESMPDMKLVAELHGVNSTYALGFANIMKEEHALIASQGRAGAGITQVESRLSRDQLGVIFHYCCGIAFESPNKLTRMLKHHEIETEKIRINNTSCYGIKVHWKVPTEWIAEHMEPEKKVRLVK